MRASINFFRSGFRRLFKAINIFVFGSSSEKQCLRMGVASAIEHRKVLRGLPSVEYIIDVGANRGQFSLCAKSVFPDAYLVAFEPLSAPFATLKAVLSTVVAHDTKVESFQYALGSENSESAIQVSKKDDSSSLLAITDVQSKIFSGTEMSHTELVSVRTLDEVLDSEVIPRNSLLKVDVQGFELEMLRGANRVLRKIRYVYVECSFVELYEGQALVSDVAKMLFEVGFELIGAHNIFRDQRGTRCVQGDFLFEKV